jgi:peptidoglycan/LPS O-acetylase OafA/YrhL
MNSGSSNNKKFVSLEWLRYFLGLYIVMFHTFNYPEVPGWLRKFFEMGFFSTSAFFVLSGFLLAHVYLREQGLPEAHMPGTSRSFWIKRLANLYPIHVGSFLLMVAVFWVIPIMGILPGDAAMSLRQVTLDMNNWAPFSSMQYRLTDGEFYTALLLNATLLHAWNPFYLTFNFPTWSISTLFFLYLLFPIMAPWLNRLKSPLGALLINNLVYLVPVLICITMGWFGSPETGILHRNPLIRLPEFAAGILLCSMYHQNSRRGVGLSRSVCVWLVVFLAASLIGASLMLTFAGELSDKGNVSYFLLHNGLLLPAQLTLIYLVVHIPNPPPNSLLSKWAKPLGNCSLPLFALHMPLFMLFARADRVLDGSPVLCFTNLSTCLASAGGKSAWHYPVFLILVTLFCISFQKQFVERIRAWVEKMLLSKKEQPAIKVANMSTAPSS